MRQSVTTMTVREEEEEGGVEQFSFRGVTLQVLMMRRAAAVNIFRALKEERTGLAGSAFPLKQLSVSPVHFFLLFFFFNLF